MRDYLKDIRGYIWTLCLFAAVYALSFGLYRLPVGAVLYPTMLCAALGLAVLVRDFTVKKRRHDAWVRVRTLTASEMADLPEPVSQEARDHREVIDMLLREYREGEARAAEGFRNMVDYYTVWAHQIKTPITSMRLTLDKEDSALSRSLKANLFQIEQYVGMVLAFLRLGSESSDYVFRQCSLAEVIGQSLSKFAAEFIDRRLSLDYDPPELTVVTDEKWLSFVLEQLLSNALKYTREGGISIYLEQPSTLCLRDTGIGIEPSDLPRVFEKGYTGFNGRRDTRSSGLGLYLCKQVCDRLGVGISIASRPGEGTCVRLNLEQYDLLAE